MTAETPQPTVSTPAKRITARQIITHPGANAYFGRSFRLRLAVLAAVMGGTSISAAGRAAGVTPQAAVKLAKSAREFAATIQSDNP